MTVINTNIKSLMASNALNMNGRVQQHTAADPRWIHALHSVSLFQKTTTSHLM